MGTAAAQGAAGGGAENEVEAGIGGGVMESRRGFVVAGAGQLWSAATVAVGAKFWIEPPRLE